MKKKVKDFLCIDTGKIAIFLIIIFLFSLIPILYLSGYVHATGDDYGYGWQTHATWLSTHSVWKTLEAAGKTSAGYWNGWQGTWFTIFLMALQPEVFWDNGYWIVPWMMLGISIFSTSLLTHYFMTEKLGLSKGTWLCSNSLLLLAMIQYFPSTKSGIFWYNGAAHYIVPYGLAMLAVYGIGKFTDTWKIRYWVLALICMAALGGASYLAPLFVLIVLAYYLLLKGRENGRSFWLLLPAVAELVGLVVSYLAPGNQVRGGTDFGIHGGLMIATVLKSFQNGAETMLTYLREKPIVFVCFLLIILLAFEGYQKMERHFTFPFPLLVVAAMYCLYCAMFAPGLYAGVELSGGVPNTIYQVFLLTFLASVLYVTGWASWKCRQKGMKIDATKLRCGGILILGVACIWLYPQKGTLKDSTFYKCYEYIASGQADDYRQQMEERLAILRDPAVKNAELPAMNADQGPLMHMEVTKDPEGWTNTVVRQFFQKESVVEVPRKG